MDNLPTRTRDGAERPIDGPSVQPEFKALSSGLGLGGNKKHSARNRLTISPSIEPMAKAPPKVVTEPPAKVQGNATKRPISQPKRSAKSRALSQSRAVNQDAGRSSRRYVAWALDFFFVVITLAITIVALTAVSMVRGGVGSWIEQKPIQWLARTNPVAILCLVYIVFLVYFLFFRILVGRTFGEAMLGTSTKSLSNALESKK